MKGNDLRRAFLDYFVSKGHEEVQSASLLIENDPTLLFSNAGMNQFKDLFLGAEKRSYSRATTSQKCLRISGKHNDFENVGLTARHHTFFEMLGNFSFGDYFKKEAISYAWEFVTEVLKLDKDRLWVTIFETDDEAEELWKSETDVPKERILRLGEKDNFWAMGDTGPCGPCSEIHYYIGNDTDKQSKEEFLKDDGSYLEIWNLVFMQYDRDKDGTMKNLPNPSIDTGMGLERVAALLQNKLSTYDCDLVKPIIASCEELSGFKYDGGSYEVKNLKEDIQYARDVAMRVIADHSRAACFLILDGVMPASDGRGYVLRRLIRRAVRHGRVLEFKEPFFKTTCLKVFEIYSNDYPELKEQADKIVRIIDAEEQKFYETLDAGLVVLNKAIEDLGSQKLFPGETAFLLHDTYGFPLDLTEDALKAHGLKVDVAAFQVAMEKQKARSREDRKGKDLQFVAQSFDAPPTIFLGYDALQANSKIADLVFKDSKESASVGEEVSVLVEETPFYAESGGQVGDSGVISHANFKLEVVDTQKVKNSFYVHVCKVKQGQISKANSTDVVTLSVNESRRNLIKINHSATHLVHQALREVLGDHVKQAGSRVDDFTSRFDYSHFEPLTVEQLAEIERKINLQIRENHEVKIENLPIEEAKKTGAIALFGEKYGDTVRVVEIGPGSIEFCGGTHVNRSGDIGLVVIKNEGGIASGVRRIECLCGRSAVEHVINERNQLSGLAQLLKSDQQSLLGRVESLISQSRDLEKENEKIKGQLAGAKSGELTKSTRVSPGGIKVIAERVDDGADAKDLRTMVDRLRVKIGSGVVVLGSASGDNALLVAGITSDLADSVDAGKIVKEAVLEIGGKGGGRKDFAQAGGLKPELLAEALDRVFNLVA